MFVHIRQAWRICGYTSHEVFTLFDIINMNSRLYEYLLEYFGYDSLDRLVSIRTSVVKTTEVRYASYRLTRYSSWQVLPKYRRNTIEKSLACLALLPAVAFAQNRIRYVYDAAGNRVRREAAVSVQKAMARRWGCRF